MVSAKDATLPGRVSELHISPHLDLHARLTGSAYLDSPKTHKSSQCPKEIALSLSFRQWNSVSCAYDYDDDVSFSEILRLKGPDDAAPSLVRNFASSFVPQRLTLSRGLPTRSP